MQSTARTPKTAVDAKAEDYWESYFGAYGKSWTRKIPRRVAAALLQRSAGVGPGQAAGMAEFATMCPLTDAPVITKEGVFIEGAVELRNEAGQYQRRLFSAAFDHEGRILALDSILAPAPTADRG